MNAIASLPTDFSSIQTLLLRSVQSRLVPAAGIVVVIEFHYQRLGKKVRVIILKDPSPTDKHY